MAKNKLEILKGMRAELEGAIAKILESGPVAEGGYILTNEYDHGNGRARGKKRLVWINEEGRKQVKIFHNIGCKEQLEWEAKVARRAAIRRHNQRIRLLDKLIELQQKHPYDTPVLSGWQGRRATFQKAS